MAAHGARRLQRLVENLDRILGIELLCATQGVEFRAPLKTSTILRKVLSAVRKEIKPMNKDRFISPDLERAATLVRNGTVLISAGLKFPELRA